MKWSRKLLVLPLLVCLYLALALPVSAAADASLTVWPTAAYAGQTHYSSGAVLSLYKLADMTIHSDGGASFTLTPEFSGLNMNPSQIPTDRTDYGNNALIQDYIWEHAIKGREVTTRQEELGKARFDSLEPGLYFFAMVGAYPEYTTQYLPLRCFTIPIPILTEGYQDAVHWEYHVTVYPKLASMDGYYYPLWENGYYPGYPIRPGAPDYPLVDPETGEPYDPDNPPPPNDTEPTVPPDGPVDLNPPSGGLPQTGLPRLPVFLFLSIGGILVILGIVLWLPHKEDGE